MRTKALFASLGLFLTCGVLRADQFQVAFSGFFFALDRSPSGAVTQLGIVEKFDTSFLYNPASLSMSNTTLDAQGLLGGNFSFAGVTDKGGETVFAWSGPGAIFTADFPDSAFATARPGAPAELGDNLFLHCLTSACNNDFVFPDPDPNGTELTHEQAAFSDVSTVPESSTLSLFVLGLLAGSLVLRRRFKAMDGGSR